MKFEYSKDVTGNKIIVAMMILFRFPNCVSIVKLHVFQIYNVHDDLLFFHKKQNKNGVRFVGQKQNKVPDYTGISYNVKEWGPTLRRPDLVNVGYMTEAAT